MKLVPTFVRKFLESLIPVQRRTVWDPRQQPTVASTLDVDRVHSIFGQADAGDPSELFTLYQDIVVGDSHLQTEFGKRKLAVCGDVAVVHPADKKNADDVATAAFVGEQIKGCPTFLKGCLHLLDSTLWPVAVVEKVFAPMNGGGFRLTKLIPVPDQLLDFSKGRLRIRATDPERGIPNGQFFEATIEDGPARYIVHRGHILSVPDHRGGPLRSLVWWWLLGAMDREWWGRFLDRYGMPFPVGKFEQADEASQSVLMRAFSYMTRLGGLVVSKDTEVELIQASSSQAGDAFEKFLAVCQREKSKLILGQTLSSESQPTGIGGGASDQQESVRQDIRMFDALSLAATLRAQLFAQLCQANRLRGAVPTLTWGGESAEGSVVTGALLSSLAMAGITLTDEGLATLGIRLGLSLQRSAAPQQRPPGSDLTLALNAARLPGLPDDADRANERIAREGAADLARAFSGLLAPVAELIRNSASPDDLQARLLTLFPQMPAARFAGLLENSLVAFAANRTSLG